MRGLYRLRNVAACDMSQDIDRTALAPVLSLPVPKCLNEARCVGISVFNVAWTNLVGFVGFRVPVAMTEINP